MVLVVRKRRAIVTQGQQIGIIWTRLRWSAWLTADTSSLRSRAILSIVSRKPLVLLAGFFVLPLMSSLAAFIAIPLLIRTGGTEGWAAVAIGQGVGGTAALVVAFGWGTIGPTEAARAERRDHPTLYWDSVWMRATLALLSIPAALGIVALLVQGEHLAAALAISAGIAAQGLSAGWFLTGQQRPYMIAAVETGPRAGAQIAAVFVVAATDDLLWYGLVVLVTELAFAGLAAVAFTRHAHRQGTIARMWEHSKRQWPLVLSGLVGAGYTRASVPIVAAIAYAAVPGFAALDRTQQFARTGIRPLTMFFQGWVVRGSGRARRATIATLALGTFVGIGVAVGLPTAGQLIFTDAISFTLFQSVAIAILITAVAGSMATGLFYLVPARAIRVFSWTSIGATVVGVPALVACTAAWGVDGAIGTLAAVELGVVIAQAAYVRWRLSTPGS